MRKRLEPARNDGQVLRVYPASVDPGYVTNKKLVGRAGHRAALSSIRPSARGKGSAPAVLLAQITPEASVKFAIAQNEHDRRNKLPFGIDR